MTLNRNWCLFLIFVAASFGHCSLQANETRPNIVVVLVDDMGIMDTSLPFLTDPQGKPVRYPLNDFYRTPNMESLAQRGIRFNQFCAMSVCSPTRISIMTGQNAARHRTTNWINPQEDNAGPQGPPDWNWKGLNRQSTTLAKAMQQAGYRTIHVGKGHFGPQKSEGENPENIGFDINVAGGAHGAPASYYGKENFNKIDPKTGKGSFNGVQGLEAYHGTDTFLTEALTIEACKHIEQSQRDGKPFFLYFPQYAVHAPFNSDTRFAPNYIDSKKSKQAQAFATLIEGMDKSLGDLMNKIEQMGCGENTILFFLGDNGSDAPLGHQHQVACAAPLRGKKGSHYEGGMRVPFIAAWLRPNPKNPNQAAFPIAVGAIQTQMAAVYDLFPTVLSLAGQPLPQGHVVDGTNLKSLMQGQPDPHRSDEFLMHYPHAPHRTDYFTTLRKGEWKVIYHYFPSDVSDQKHYQLFHLASDPFEQQDRASTDPKVLHTMMERMVAMLGEQKAVLPRDPSNGQPLVPKLP